MKMTEMNLVFVGGGVTLLNEVKSHIEVFHYEKNQSFQLFFVQCPSFPFAF
jgi:hypothetical protein